MEEVVAGLDIGTSSIKLVLYGKKGVLYSARFSHVTEGSSGREINPLQLVKDIINLIQRARNDNSNVRITAIGLSSLFPSFIALDEKGEPLTNIITWMDPRGNELVKEFKKNEKEASKLQEKTGCIIHESYTLWKILWFKKKHPDLFTKVNKFLTLSHFLTYKLTGKFVISYALASTTGLFNITTLEWDKEILTMAGISETQLSVCYNIYHTEKLRNNIREDIGLDKEVTLVLGAGDGQLSNIGSGCLSDGTICSTIGTSSALRIIGGSQKYSKSVWKYFLYDKTYIDGIAINAGLSSLAWFYKNIFHKESNNIFSDIDKIDLEQPSSLIFLPFLDGERGPNYNQNMTASFFGLNSKSTDKDVYRAILEGIFFNLYDCYRILVNPDEEPKEMVATGGYINSEKLIQMQSDIFNIKIKVPNFKEASAVGAAIVSLVATGKISALSEINITYEKEFLPDPIKHKKYMEKFRDYKKKYEQSISRILSQEKPDL